MPTMRPPRTIRTTRHDHAAPPQPGWPPPRSWPALWRLAQASQASDRMHGLRTCVDGVVARKAADLTDADVRWLGGLDLGRFSSAEPPPCLPTLVVLVGEIPVYLWPITVRRWASRRATWPLAEIEPHLVMAP